MRVPILLNVVLASLIAVEAGAQDFTETVLNLDESTIARIDHLEQELATLRSSLRAGAHGPSCRDESDYCGVTCCCDTHTSGAYAGAALVIAKVHFKEAFETSTIDLTTGTLNLSPFDYDYELNSRAWLGYVAPNLLGVRAAYAHFDQRATPTALTSTLTTVHSAQVVSVNIPAAITTTAPGQTLAINSSLNAETVDLEGTISVKSAGIKIMASGGVRYAKLDQDSIAVILDGITPLQQLTWERNFEGIGPTLGAEFHKPVGCSGLALYGMGRGSLLFGHKSLSRFVNPATGAIPAIPFARLGSADEVVPIFDLGFGLEWASDFQRGQLFARGTYEGQLWAEAGAPTLGFLGFQGFVMHMGWQH